VFVLSAIATAAAQEPKVGLVRTDEGHTDKVNNLVLSPDGDLALSTSDDNTARIWEVESGRVVHVLKGHKNMVLCGAFSPNGRLALTGGGLDLTSKPNAFLPGKDHRLRLWDVVSAKMVRELGGQR
jgi:eukaryotic-like serine/threonine-protein kinase